MKKLNILFIVFTVFLFFNLNSFAQVTDKAEPAITATKGTLKNLNKNMSRNIESESSFFERKIDLTNNSVFYCLPKMPLNVYQRYDIYGNYSGDSKPITDLRYECTVCNGTGVLNGVSGSDGVIASVICRKCNGKGYLISNSNK